MYMHYISLVLFVSFLALMGVVFFFFKNCVSIHPCCVVYLYLWHEDVTHNKIKHDT